MTSSFFPDINVWIALHLREHDHHAQAQAWFTSLASTDQLVWCRHTQIGMFRLLTTDSVTQGASLTQKRCWDIYHHWILSGRAVLREEPVGVDAAFEQLTSADSSSPRVWADAYLAAFAELARLTLVTFDKALAKKARGALLLG
jgi:toxin-antitoxin system PIN domain toxin